MVAQPHDGLHAVVDGAGRSQQVTGIGETSGCVGAPAVLPGIGGLGRRESENTVGAGIRVRRKSFKQRLAAGLVTMVSLHPGQVDIEGRFVVDEVFVGSEMTCGLGEASAGSVSA